MDPYSTIRFDSLHPGVLLDQLAMSKSGASRQVFSFDDLRVSLSQEFHMWICYLEADGGLAIGCLGKSGGFNLTGDLSGDHHRFTLDLFYAISKASPGSDLL